MAGNKHDDAKISYKFEDPAVRLLLNHVLSIGANKYGEFNYMEGLAYMRYYSAFTRHVEAWKSKIDYDDETGLPHLVHAYASLHMLISNIIRSSGYDDRPPSVDYDPRFTNKTGGSHR